MKMARSLKERLIAQSVERQLGKVQETASTTGARVSHVHKNYSDFREHPGWKQLDIMRQAGERLGVTDPFFRMHDGIAGCTTQINGQACINFSSYNYLNLSGDPRVIAAANNAAQRYGASVSASRMVSGERPIHQSLERELASVYQADDALVFVSGHATNVSVIGYLMGNRDLIIHDELIHNSSLVGAQLSGATRMAFRHNDSDHLEQLLNAHRSRYERVLIVSEGLFSMDGDTPNLDELVRIKRAFDAWLMVDEAHALGVLGETGLGSHQLCRIDPSDVDIWMGTLSKTLSGCGGYIAGCRELIDILRHWAPGFLYSVGMPAMMAAAALESLRIMRAEPERASELQQNGRFFTDSAISEGWDLGSCEGYAVVPIILGSSLRATQMSNRLLDRGINVQPILYPAVPEKSARLRFFISSAHTQEQLTETLRVLKEIRDNR